MLKTLLLILPLALDTFAVSAAISMAGLPRKDRLRVSLIFAGFEMLMPLIGFGIGHLLGNRIGHTADYLAIGLLVAVGIHMLIPEREDEGDEVRAAASVHGLAIIGLGLSISLDELAIGFTIGLLRLPIILIVILIGAQALIAAQLGHQFGARLGAATTDRAETLAGAALVLLAVALLVTQIA
jgi:manganese efflux pump family protein